MLHVSTRPSLWGTGFTAAITLDEGDGLPASLRPTWYGHGETEGAAERTYLGADTGAGTPEAAGEADG